MELRKQETARVKTALGLGRHLILEGPVGVGKTHLALEVLEGLKKKYVRVDGDTRYTEQKLTGWFDPPLVLKKGYSKDTFVAGPLVEAMQKGEVLFINELNRMPEAVQNILLPALDEKKIQIPKMGEIKAKKGFCVIATQNPKEFTATHALSEALLDRFEWIQLNYLEEQEELLILKNIAKGHSVPVDEIVRILRRTRIHPEIKRGASLRAAIACVEYMKSDLSLKESVLLTFATRIDLLDPNADRVDFLSRLVEDGELPLTKKKEIRLA